MTNAATARARPRLRGDPALLATVAILWLLLALFVIYPLLMLAGAAFVQDGSPALAPLKEPSDALRPSEKPSATASAPTPAPPSARPRLRRSPGGPVLLEGAGAPPP